MVVAMGSGAGIDVTAIVESVRRRLQRGTPRRPATPPFDPHVKTEIATLRQSSDLYALPLASAEGFAPSAMAFFRKAVRRVLLPWISRQSSYNATTARVLDSLRDQTELLAYHQALSTEELLDA